ESSQLITFNYRGNSKVWKCEISWKKLFFTVSRWTVASGKEWDVKSALSLSILKNFEETPDFNELCNEMETSVLKKSEFRISEKSFEMIRNQLLALDLIEIKSSTYEKASIFGQGNQTDILRIWELSKKGKIIYLDQIAIKNKDK
ncbi:MAG TPA: hypothetical protein PKY59_15190, partial [Pyrinomonadaceae bacterium]|nr:hypothetical protein [Pyrinomonadaceae bacterium]